MDHDPKNRSTLTPANIRAIRQRLGLTQLQAGELLGGGPRSFTKYEAGSVKPAAGVVALLRVLDANPSMLATLRGESHRPVSSTSSPDTPPFGISSRHLRDLDSETFTELLRRLLGSEAVAHRLPLDSFHVPSTATAPDGGEDGHIAWTGSPDRTDFLPCRENQFQLKCGKVLPNSAGREVLTGKGQVKSMVRDVLGSGGCYTLLSNRPYTRQAINVREERISASLRAANLTVKEGQVRFREADWIATWVNRHPSIAIWVRELTQPGTVRPFRSWDHWAGSSEHQASPWVDDDRLASLRASVLQRTALEQGVIHIRGLPGVGKSRLVLEALRSADEGNIAIRDFVMYADEADSTLREIRETAETLAAAESRAIIVIDRCTPGTRRAVTGAVNRPGSRLSLITIEDDALPAPTDPETLVVPEAPPEVTAKIVEHLAPNLPPEDTRRLELLSRGFPRHTLAVVKAWKDSVLPPHATEDDIVESFVVGRDTSQANLLMASARLLAVFGALRTGPRSEQSQLQEVAHLQHDIVAEEFYAGIQRLVSRSVAKQRGGLVVFSPSPIALQLAERQWREWMPDRWDEILAGSSSPELMGFAARRLALLNTTGISQEVAAHLCRAGGPLDGLEGISDPSHSAVLAALVQVDARRVVDLLTQSLESVPDLSEIRDDARRNIVRTLEQAAFLPDTFEDAARLLLDLAAAENEPYANNATEVFMALFPLLLGKTATGKSSRLAFLDEVAVTTDLRRRSIVVKALIAGIKTDHFHRDVGAETHGLRPTLHSWHPTTTEEAAAYLTGCVERLADFSIADDPAGKAARERLGGSLRSLISSGRVEMALVKRLVGQVQRQVGAPWKEAIRSLNHFLRFNAKEASPSRVDQVKALVEALQPSDLKPRALHLISQYASDYPPSEESDIDAARKRLMDDIRSVAEELARQPIVLTSVLLGASSGPQVNASWFGECVAEAAESPVDWLEPVKDAFLGAPECLRNWELLAGFLYGLSKTHPSAVIEFKRMAARSEEFAPILPAVCAHRGVTPADIVLVTEAIRANLLPPHRLMQWTLAAKRDKLSASDLVPLLDALLDHDCEGFAVAVHLICTYTTDAPDEIDCFGSQVTRMAEGVTRWEHTEVDAMTEDRFAHLVEMVLKRGRLDTEARTLALTVAGAFVESLGTDNARLVEPLLRRLLSDFPEIAWPLIGQAIVSKDSRHGHLEFALGDSPIPGTPPKPPILSLTEETLFAWCQAHPDGAPAFVAATVPFLATDEEGAPTSTLHPVMTRLIDEFGHCPGVPAAVSRNIGSFSCVGSATAVLQLYLEPLTALQGHARREVRNWAKTELRGVEDSIEIVKARDAESMARSEF